MKGGREQFGAVCLKDQSFKLGDNLIDGMSSEEQYKLVREALRVFLRYGKADFPLLLKHLGIDLKCGQKLIGFFEKEGFVGFEKPDRSRDLLITKERFEEMFGETVTAYIHLDEQRFEAVASGEKTVELCVGDKFKALKVGDKVEFVGPSRCIRVEVTKLDFAKTFSALDIATLNAAGLKDVKANGVDEYMRSFFGKKEVAHNGVVAVSFKTFEVR